MTLVWQHGVGAELVFGAEASGSIEFWAPMMVFAFLYGLSMEYEAAGRAWRYRMPHMQVHGRARSRAH